MWVSLVRKGFESVSRIGGTGLQKREYQENIRKYKEIQENINVRKIVMKNGVEMQ